MKYWKEEESATNILNFPFYCQNFKTISMICSFEYKPTIQAGDAGFQTTNMQ